MDVSYNAIFSWKHLKNSTGAPFSANWVCICHDNKGVNYYISSLGMPFLPRYKAWEDILGPFFSRRSQLFSGRVQIDDGDSSFGGMDPEELFLMLSPTGYHLGTDRHHRQGCLESYHWVVD